MKSPRTKDIDVRIAITSRLLASGWKRRDIRHELTLDSSSSDGRADMVLLDEDWLTGIEIKSGADRLDRCEEQARRYHARFDSSLLVMDPRHEPPNPPPIQHEWGVSHPSAPNNTGFDYIALAVPEGASITFTRPVRWYPRWSKYPWDRENWEVERGRSRGQQRQVISDVLSLLWADEALTVAAQLVQEGHVPQSAQCRTRSGTIHNLHEHASIARLRPLIVAALRARQLNRWEQAFWKTYDQKMEVCDESIA
jgi:hypothetical protein